MNNMEEICAKSANGVTARDLASMLPNDMEEEEDDRGPPLPSRLQQRVVVADDDLEEEVDMGESDMQLLPSWTAQRYMVQSDLEEDESDQICRLRKMPKPVDGRKMLHYQFPEIAEVQRKESGHVHSNMVGKFRVGEYHRVAARETAIQAAVSTATSAGTTDLMIVQAAVSAYTKAENQTEIPADIAIWIQFPPKTLSLLATAARNPTNWDMSPFLADGMVQISQPDDVPPMLVVANYIHRISVPSNKVHEAPQQYPSQHPADAGNTILQSVMHSSDLKKVMVEFHQAMIEYGLEDAVDMLFEEIKACPLTPPYATLDSPVPIPAHGVEDLEAGRDVQIVNFLKARRNLNFTMFHLQEMNTGIEDPLDIHVNPIVSQKERIVHTVLGAAAMSSAHSEVLHILLPSPELLQLHNVICASLMLDPFPLGQERDLLLEGQICSLLDNEAEVLHGLNDDRIPSVVLKKTKQYAADVVCLKHGRHVKLKLTKDIPEEAFRTCGEVYWESNVGQGPREHRHICQLLEPQIPAQDDLDLDVLALHIRPTLNFWQLILRHWCYYLHSNLVAAIMHSSNLAFMDGNLLIGLANCLPDKAYRSFHKGDFTAVIGVLMIVQTGHDAAGLALMVAHGHYGHHKYNVIIACPRWNINFLVKIIAETTVQVIAQVLHNCMIEWTDPTQVQRLLECIKMRMEAALLCSGVTKVLEGAKNKAQWVELRSSLSTSCELRGRPRRSTMPGFMTAQIGVRRHGATLESILHWARELDSYSLPPDLDHLGSFLHPILSPSFPNWFMQLADNTDVVYALNTLGRSEESTAATKANQKAIGQWRKTHTVEVYADTAAIKRHSMIEVIQDGHNGAYHLCEVTGLQKQVISANFPSLEQVHYTHNILNNPHMQAALEDIADVLAQLDLVAICDPKFLPANFDQRITWSVKQAQTLETWFTSTTCYPTLEKPAFFLSTAVIFSIKKQGLLVKDGCVCTVCNNKKKM
ncbi:hypothetical protein B0H17DRAFT_1135203 [Mycena rosella]|uniref:Uncharacterized protein n=1 Tax=Mycena rosella TaxID=1033263 RepID=A0AAD7DDQ2_MYCRO|nr:hypothetical protein B0H17DRAFT_1135203 [Mycena rosella]